MATTAYARATTFYGTALPRLWSPRVEPPLFGNIAIVAFLLAQIFDGIFTYIGVSTYGVGVEGNPLIVTLMTTFGHGTALVSAKMVAAFLGVCLHLYEIHSAVALLAGFYFAVAILPWMAILII
jgi:uncharacterized membrane protein